MPTPSADRTKLPRTNSAPAKPRVMFLDYDGSVYPDPVAKSIPCAVIPCNLENRKLARRSAREKIKREQFFDLPQEEQVERIAKQIWRARKRYALPPLPIKQLQTIYRRQARAVLALLNSGSAKQAQGRKGR